MTDPTNNGGREFPITVVLSITGGKLLCDFGKMHECLEYLAGEPVWTHQFGRVVDEARPVLHARHPQLQSIDVSDVSRENAETRIAEIKAAYPEPLLLAPLAADHHERIDPESELAEKVHPDRIIKL